MKVEMKVYVVTHGSYSDFGIDSVWSTREKADAYILEQRRGHNNDINDDIDEYDVDSTSFSTVKMLVKMTMEGNVLETSLTTKEAGFAGFFHTKDWDWKDSEQQNLWWVVNTEDPIQAVKATNEKRAIILAHNLWDKWTGVYDLFSKSSQNGE